MSTAEVAKILGEKWRALSDDEKMQWQEKAKQANNEGGKDVSRVK